MERTRNALSHIGSATECEWCLNASKIATLFVPLFVVIAIACIIKLAVACITITSITNVYKYNRVYCVSMCVSEVCSIRLSTAVHYPPTHNHLTQYQEIIRKFVLYISFTIHMYFYIHSTRLT